MKLLLDLNLPKLEEKSHKDNVLKNNGGAQTILDKRVVNSIIHVNGGNKISSVKGISKWINSCNKGTINLEQYNGRSSLSTIKNIEILNKGDK